MRAFTLVAPSIGLVLALQLACGSGSDKPRSTGSGGGDETGGGGGTPTGGISGKGGAAGATAGTGGGDPVSPDAAAGSAADATSPSPDAAPPGTGGQGGGNQGGAGGASDGGAVAADTWDSFAKGFFATYCVSCHNDDKKGDATRDYLVMGNVVKEKVEIACGVAKSQADFSKRGCSGFPPARQFPVGSGPKPTDADRDRLLRWIDSGTP